VMTRRDEQFRRNSNQVNDAEQRLAGQHVFIQRLRASGNDTRSAEKALEVMRDILRELYCAQSLAAQGGEPQAQVRRYASKRRGVRLDTVADDVASAAFLAIKAHRLDRFRLTASPVLCG
jgi:hypothetical protein